MDKFHIYQLSGTNTHHNVSHSQIIISQSLSLNQELFSPGGSGGQGVAEHCRSLVPAPDLFLRSSRQVLPALLLVLVIFRFSKEVLKFWCVLELPGVFIPTTDSYSHSGDGSSVDCRGSGH